MVLGIVSCFVWQPSGTTVEPRPEPLPLPQPDIMTRVTSIRSGGLCEDAAFVSQPRKALLINFNLSIISAKCELSHSQVVQNS